MDPLFSITIFVNVLVTVNISLTPKPEFVVTLRQNDTRIVVTIAPELKIHIRFLFSGTAVDVLTYSAMDMVLYLLTVAGI